MLHLDQPPTRRSRRARSSKTIVLVAEAAESDAILSFDLPKSLQEPVVRNDCVRKDIVRKDRMRSRDDVLSSQLEWIEKEISDIGETPSTKKVLGASDDAKEYNITYDQRMKRAGGDESEILDVEVTEAEPDTLTKDARKVVRESLRV